MAQAPAIYLTPVRDREERRVSKAKISLMRSKEFALWSGIMMMGDTKVVDDIPTACTNGRDESYGRAFIASQNDKQVAFLILHENLHKALRHLTTWKKLMLEDANLANQAMDYVINLVIVHTDPSGKYTQIPTIDGKECALIDRKFTGMNTKQVFDWLKQEKEEGGGGSGPPLDEHDWAGAEALSEEAKQELAKDIDQALRQGRMQHDKLNGKGGAGMPCELGDLLEPQIDWKEVLKEFVRSYCRAKQVSSWRRVNRRFIGEDIYMPSLIGETVGRMVVGIDTSGSIRTAELNLFLSEVKSVVDEIRPDSLDLIYWDAAVAGVETYTQDSMDSLITSTKPKGGGGTDPRCVQDYLNDPTNNTSGSSEPPACIIMLTDGYVGSWGDNWPAPILWVVSDNESATASCGVTLHINSK